LSEKIHISLGDLNSPHVDQKLQQQSAMDRTTEHYRQQTIPPGANSSGSILYNTLFYMTLFGFVGGLVAWIPCEVVSRIMQREADEYLEMRAKVMQLVIDVEAGNIAEEEAIGQIEKLGVRYADNEFVTLLQDESLSEAQKEAKIEQLWEKAETEGVIRMVLVCALAGMSISFFLSIADASVGRNIREIIINGSVGLCLGMLGGIIVGLFINKLLKLKS